MPCLILYSKAKFACYSRYLLTSYFCIPVLYNGKDIFWDTAAKLAAGVTDTAVTMAVKSHLRGGKPVVLAFGSNDGLSASAKNIGELLNRKHYYFVPFYQDDPEKKPRSLASDYSLLESAILAAQRGEQLQPILR